MLTPAVLVVVAAVLLGTGLLLVLLLPQLSLRA